MGDMGDMDMVPWCFLSKRSGGRPTVAVFFFSHGEVHRGGI